ncbi:MAG TPA: S8 family peptidase [Thermoanaerobaculia bacterium]
MIAFAVTLAAGPPDRTLVPRRPANKQTARLPLDTAVETVILKFQEGTHVRMRGRSLTAASGRDLRETAKLAKLGLNPNQVDNDLRAVQALLASSKLLRNFDRLFTIPEEDLAAWRASGEERSGEELADLDLYYAADVPKGTTQAQVNLLLDTLNTFPSIEIAYATAPPQLAVDISPPTPNYQPNQGYLNAAPNGINALYAWNIPGGRGSGTKIVDIEGDWRTTHEDLPAMFYTGGTRSGIMDQRNHGSAVMGVMVAGNNGYGITGIAHQAQIGYRASGNSRAIATAVTNASMAVGISGLVLIEMHWPGPTTSSTPCGCSANPPSQCDFVPMEFWQDNYDAIATATANGRIVVEAAGNGATNLDDPVYNSVFNRGFRDSGAILVGAGAANLRSPSCFTNWGSRVDLQGWGDSIWTLGYGDAFGGGDENQFYTFQFGGTSGASPIVTGAAASIIGVSLADGQGYGGRTPREIR